MLDIIKCTVWRSFLIDIIWSCGKTLLKLFKTSEQSEGLSYAKLSKRWHMGWVWSVKRWNRKNCFHTFISIKNIKIFDRFAQTYLIEGTIDRSVSFSWVERNTSSIIPPEFRLETIIQVHQVTSIFQFEKFWAYNSSS